MPTIGLSQIGLKSLFHFLPILIALFSVSLSSKAQDINHNIQIDSIADSGNNMLDSTRQRYIREYSDYFNLKALILNKNLSLSLNSSDKGNPQINYLPNSRGYFGLGAYIFDLGLEFAIKVPSFQKSIEQYGSTKFSDLQASLYAKKICGDLTIQRYEGFYIDNPKDLNPDWRATDQYPYRPDLIVSNVYGNFVFILNDEKYSYRSGFTQSDRQVKSAGSVILMSTLTRVRMRADSVIIPYEVREGYGEKTFFEFGRFLTFSAGPGYGHNFVLKDLYLNFNVALQLGMQHQKYITNEVTKRNFTLEPNAHFRGAIGYDNDRFFAGTSFIVQQSTISIDELNVATASSNFRIFVGYRFRESGILKKYKAIDILNKGLRKLNIGPRY